MIRLKFKKNISLLDFCCDGIKEDEDVTLILDNLMAPNCITNFKVQEGYLI